MNDDDQGDNGIRYAPLQRATLSRTEAAVHLGLSAKSLQRLADRGELIPCSYSRPFRFSLVELDRFLVEHVENERRRRRV